MIWATYLIIYNFLSLFNLWYNYFFILTKKNIFNKEYLTKVSIIIPFYNEDKETITSTIKSVEKAGNYYKSKGGDYEIFAVDDGSPNKTNISHLIRYEDNRGKREAQAEALRYVKGELIITVDSDTDIKEDGIYELVKPFNNKSIGAVTGNVFVKETKFFLTKLLDVRMWNAFNLERKRQSAYNIVTCCSGCFSAYRTKLFKANKERYINQMFLDKKCTYGDDRAMTNFILKDYGVAYQETAICYTSMPTTIKGFLKQNKRWKKSYLRETYFLLKFAWKRSKFLFFDTIYNLIMPFFSLGARVMLVLIMILHPSSILWILGSIFIISSVYNSMQIMTRGVKGFYGFFYALLHEFLIYPLLYIALFTLSDTRWGTRD